MAENRPPQHTTMAHPMSVGEPPPPPRRWPAPPAAVNQKVNDDDKTGKKGKLVKTASDMGKTAGGKTAGGKTADDMGKKDDKPLKSGLPMAKKGKGKKGGKEEWMTPKASPPQEKSKGGKGKFKKTPTLLLPAAVPAAARSSRPRRLP